MCSAPSPKAEKELIQKPEIELKDSTSIEIYQSRHANSGESSSMGKVSNGSLENGYLVPFQGKNFKYFDTTSYLAGRAFVNSRVYNTILAAYDSLSKVSSVYFGLMECSNEHGGKLYPHRTHQNGLSCDFMSPLLKNGKTTTELNNLGADHYFMTFNKEGVYSEDPAVSIDFNSIAQHLLILKTLAPNFGLRIDKVILKLELKDELFATKYGRELQKSGIYFATSLSHLINELHDDHYHVDFEPVN